MLLGSSLLFRLILLPGGCELFNLDVLEAHNVTVPAECDVAFAMLWSQVLQLGVVNLIEIGFHDYGSVELHFDMGSVDRDRFLVPLALGFKCPFLAATKV